MTRNLRSAGLSTLAINVTTTVSLDPIDELPQLPEGLAAPEVSFDFGPEDGKLYVYLTFAVDGEEFWVHFWINDQGETFNSIHAGEEEHPFSADDLEAVLSYGAEITERIDSTVAAVNYATGHSDDARAQIIQASIGKVQASDEQIAAMFVEVGDRLLGENGSTVTVLDVDDYPLDPTKVYFDTEFGRILRDKGDEVTVLRIIRTFD